MTFEEAAVNIFQALGTDTMILIVILAIFILLLITIGSVQFFTEFRKELKYINNEIARNRGSERRYWIKRRRKLWLSLIPFVRY